MSASRLRAADPAALELVLERLRGTGSRPVVLIDGGSGAGKSRFAAALAPRIRDEFGAVQLVSLDDVFPGWDGLAAGSRAVHETMLRDREPGWRRYDWRAGQLAEWVSVDPRRPLLVEGCGALSRANCACATLAVWIELDAVERRRRALERDGDVFRPHWERWEAADAAFRVAERPDELADVTLFGG